MCDYSLHDVRSRRAQTGDRLTLSKFGSYKVSGFGRPEDGNECVTCIPHGTILAITGADNGARKAIFGHNDNGEWRDGLIFEDEPQVVVSLQNLPLGVQAMVEKLPQQATKVESRAHEWSGTI